MSRLARTAELMRMAPHVYGAALAASGDERAAAGVTERVLGGEGSRRGGDRARPAGRARDLRAALTGVGLDVSGLEAERRLTLEQIQLAEPPEQLPRRLDSGFDEAVEHGLSTLWSSHTSVGPDSGSFAYAMEVERAWEEHFRDRPVVKLCPYVVGGLDAPSALGRLTGLGAGHDGVLVPSDEGLELFRPARAPGAP